MIPRFNDEHCYQKVCANAKRSLPLWYKGFCPVLIYKNDPILNAEYVIHKDCSCSSLDHRLPWSSQVPEIYFSNGLFAQSLDENVLKERDVGEERGDGRD